MPRCYPALVMLLALAAGCSKPLAHTFEMPREEIQSKAASKFPMRTADKGKDSPINATLTDPVVILEEGKDQIGLRFAVQLEPAGPVPPIPPLSRSSGHAILFFSISYDPDRKAIRLSNPRVTELRLDSLPADLTEPLSRLVEASLVQQWANDPLPLDSRNVIDQGVNTFLKSVTVRNGKLLVEIGW